MTARDDHGKASPVKGGRPQQNNTGKESRNASTIIGNTDISDLEQKKSSNKGKGPSGENL